LVDFGRSGLLGLVLPQHLAFLADFQLSEAYGEPQARYTLFLSLSSFELGRGGCRARSSWCGTSSLLRAFSSVHAAVTFESGKRWSMNSARTGPFSPVDTRHCFVPRSLFKPILSYEYSPVCTSPHAGPWSFSLSPGAFIRRTVRAPCTSRQTRLPETRHGSSTVPRCFPFSDARVTPVGFFRGGALALKSDLTLDRIPRCQSRFWVI